VFSQATLTGLYALLAIAVHSFVDFNLYIPANAMLLAWIAGVTMAVELRASKVNVREELEHLNVATWEAIEIGSCRQMYV
jgi:hypothetical protein